MHGRVAGAVAILAGMLPIVAGAAQGRARLVLADREPVTVFGYGFVAGEHVTVRVSPFDSASFTKSVDARPTGRLAAVFRAHLDGCAGFTITARGSAGTRVVVRELVPPPCGAELAP